MKRILLPLLVAFLALPVLRAQQPLKYCGTDETMLEFYNNHPQLQGDMLANRDFLRQFTQSYLANAARSNSDSLYIIPVVFHIIHSYGAENISDEQVMSGLKVMNWNFRKQNPDTSSIVTAFKPIAADCEIEFRLAHLDPDGHCTSGINRIASPLTAIGDHSVKDLIHWDPAKYLNIYVVRSIATLAGHCLMPDQAAVKPEWDGMVIDDSYIGDIGTSNDLRSVVLAHEAGHYLNLFHIWGGNNVPGYFYLPVGQQSNCGVGDDVDDTPATIGWSNCNLAAASCGNAVDNVQNAMDYSYCNFMFTQGQRQRMRAALNSPVANRNHLITAQNLQATGVNITDLCAAWFSASRQTICASDTVYFTDKSVAVPDSWLWDFGDGETSTAQNPFHVYQLPGDYQARLTAGKSGISVVSANTTIRVNGAAGANAFYVQGFEGINNISATQLLHSSDQPALFYSLAGTGYNSSTSAVIRMADTTAAYAGRVTLISPAINLSNTTLPSFSFKYACSQKVLNANDKLDVYTSTNCGKTWVLLGSKTGANLRTLTTAETDSSWLPADSTGWKTANYLIAGNSATDNFMFKIEFTGYRTNNFYIDNIQLNPSAYTGLQKIPLTEVELVPNPASSFITITGLPQAMPFTITDINGKVWQSSMLENNAAVNIQQLPAGVYILRIENPLAYSIKRFIKY